MIFKQKTNGDALISYFSGCGDQGKGVAVDVLAGDESWYLDQARALNVDITHVFDTHIHADHLSGGRALAGQVGASYLLHESDIGKTAFRFTPAYDGQVIDVVTLESRCCIHQAIRKTAFVYCSRTSGMRACHGLC